ncbi:MAG: thioredoxin family protein [Bacteroidota bacterium]
MKPFCIFLLLLGLSADIYAQEGIQFFEGTYEEALEQAKAENKVIFLFADAVWNGSGKRMKKSAFLDPEVVTYHHANFINLDVDMERGEGPQLARKFRIMAYPTLLYLDKEGNVIQKHTGALSTIDLLEMSQKAISLK